MYIPGHLYKILDDIDDQAWQELLLRHRFWECDGFTVDCDHRDVAFHILISEGMIARSSLITRQPAHHEFDAVPISDTHFDDPSLVEQAVLWSELHARNYGAGRTVKMGWYTIGPGGSVGHHIDGPIFLRGERADLGVPHIQRGLVDLHCSHRTILPLQFNTQDEFLICNHRVPMRRGGLFEFSNVLPHAYLNRGKEHSVLLVTTYLREDFLPNEAIDGN